jgi:hypothetical protein
MLCRIVAAICFTIHLFSDTSRAIANSHSSVINFSVTATTLMYVVSESLERLPSKSTNTPFCKRLSNPKQSEAFGTPQLLSYACISLAKFSQVCREFK